MNITEFLLARVAEDEAENADYAKLEDDDARGWAIAYAQRVLAECAAKRTILEDHEPVDYSGIGMASPNACVLCGAERNMHDWEWIPNSFPCNTVRGLASVYSDHPDYRQEWAIG
jgi:hypothetical protein